MKVRIYVEGGPRGADANGAREIRKAFKQHLERLDPRLKTLEVVASGSTDQTMRNYAEGFRVHSADRSVALLVDSDAPVTAITPAKHLEAKLNSAKVPQDARTNIFLMVQCMEAWLVTDEAVLERCFGNKLRASALPQNLDVEAVSKTRVLEALESAIKPTPTGHYHKVRHGSEILAALNPARVGERSRHARDLHAFLRNSAQA